VEGTRDEILRHRPHVLRSLLSAGRPAV